VEELGNSSGGTEQLQVKELGSSSGGTEKLQVQGTT
jgi:hypothetical protein